MTTRTHPLPELTSEQLDRAIAILVDVCEEMFHVTPTIQVQPDYVFMDDPDEYEVTRIIAGLRGEAPDAWTLDAEVEAAKRMREAGIEPDDRVFTYYISPFD